MYSILCILPDVRSREPDPFNVIPQLCSVGTLFCILNYIKKNSYLIPKYCGKLISYLQMISDYSSYSSNTNDSRWSTKMLQYQGNAFVI